MVCAHFRVHALVRSSIVYKRILILFIGLFPAGSCARAPGEPPGSLVFAHRSSSSPYDRALVTRNLLT